MTYLITSNTQKTGREVNTTGINDPSSYVNMLSQTFEIEKDSEIAVESLKITRNGNIQLSSANNQFGVYIGHSLNGCQTDLMFDVGFPVNTFIRGGNETLSPQSLTTNIKEGLMAGLGQHPNYVLRDSEYPKVELKNGSNEFQGFKYTFSQSASTLKTNIPAVAGQGGWVSTTVEDINATITASATEVVIKKDGDESLYNDCSVIGQKFPLNMASGSFVVYYNSSLSGSAGDIWAVGLTRATLNACQSSDVNGCPYYYDNGQIKDYNTGFANSRRFFDYGVEDKGDGKLRVFYAGAPSNNLGFQEPKKIETNYGTLKNASEFIGVKFTAIGDSIDVALVKPDGSLEVIVNNLTAVDKPPKTKAVTVTNFYLYPKINMYDNPSASRIMVVKGFDGLDIPTYNFKSGVSGSFQYGGRFDTGIANVPALRGNIIGGDLTFKDWWAHQYQIGNQGLCKMFDCRSYNELDISAELKREGLNASGQVPYDIVLITAPSEAYNGLFNGGQRGAIGDFGDQTEVYGDWTDGFGAQNILGFENVPPQYVNTYVSATQGNLVVLESKTTPKMISSKSLFIRLPDLPINSFNTGKGSVSKILYHMPRFDNSGAEVGGLYFQPPERLYIPLNNIEKIRLNNIKVELCNIDETNGNTDLVGQTIVCLDIRRRR